MLMLLSAHMREQAECVCVCLSMSIFVYAGLYIHLCACICTFTAMCVRVRAVSLPPLAPPAELRIGGDRRIDEIFNCRVFKRTTDALFC